MNKCLNCNKETLNSKYCSISCRNKHQGPIQAEKLYGKFKDFKVSCHLCNKEFIINEREKLFPNKEKYFCSRKCSNIRNISIETKQKIRETLKKTNKTLKRNKKGKYKNRHDDITLICKECKNIFIVSWAKRNRQFCSISCKNKVIGRKGGLKSAISQNRRSKNEVLFADLCTKHFKKVLTNKPIFNGWDADVILENEKIAILWNGKWHYEKITKKHSLKQVQNRDRIKLKEIKKAGYVPYIIKDMGSHNPTFVKEQFEIFLNNY